MLCSPSAKLSQGNSSTVVQVFTPATAGVLSFGKWLLLFRAQSRQRS